MRNNHAYPNMKNKNINTHLKYLFNLAYKQVITLEPFYTLSKKYQVRIALDIKRNTCFKCYSFLIANVTCNSRILKKQNGTCIEIVCKCGNVKYFYFKGQKGIKS